LIPINFSVLNILKIFQGETFADRSTTNGWNLRKTFTTHHLQLRAQCFSYFIVDWMEIRQWVHSAFHARNTPPLNKNIWILSDTTKVYTGISITNMEITSTWVDWKIYIYSKKSWYCKGFRNAKNEYRYQKFKAFAGSRTKYTIWFITAFYRNKSYQTKHSNFFILFL